MINWFNESSVASCLIYLDLHGGNYRTSYKAERTHVLLMALLCLALLAWPGWPALSILHAPSWPG